ncbi:preprotein translocase subunit SecY [Candidatus Bathyarchaeota archaeon RBG_13_60_20]|nr:MAG: preprotein translocase subunit SecY [Candidatus Bathyarchaeota archaeon RBG_13_60_20]
MVRFLDLFKPVSRFIPEVRAPQKKVPFNARLMWTLAALIVYLIMSEIPLYGVTTGGTTDPYATLRIIFASNRGTLLELGIGPIVTAGLIIQLLAGSNIISFDRSDPEDRGLFTTASKVFSFVMVIVQASLYIVSGVYGVISTTQSVLIFVQLLAAGMVIMMLDELVQKGWGIGSGISLFIVAGITQNIWWMSFSIAPPPGGDGRSYGAIVALFQGIMGGLAPLEWIYRSGWPDMIGFLMTLVVFAFVVYVEGMRVEIPISHSSYRGYRSRMPIKLLYVSNIPVILAYAMFANIQLVGQFVWSRWNADNTNFVFNMLGMYNRTESGGMDAIGGLAYYTTSPGSLSGVAADPIRAMLYLLIVVGFCVLFSLTWLEIGGLGADQMADQLLQSGMQVAGFRRSKKPLEKLLNRYIPTITLIGGMIVGLLAATSEFFGVFGSGMGALLAVSILYQYYQTMVQEQVEDLYPFLRGALG